jgi:hypothetical protein
MNPSELPSVSTTRVDKSGKGKFAPSIGGRKSGTAAAAASSSATQSTSAPNTFAAAQLESHHVPLRTTRAADETAAIGASVQMALDPEPAEKREQGALPGRKIEPIQSRRQQLQQQQNQQQKASAAAVSPTLPETPKAASLLATAAAVAADVSARKGPKRTMAYFLKDNGEGKEMSSTAGGASSQSSAPGSPKTRRVVDLKRIKVSRSASGTSSQTTALAPQVRIVDGAIVYDESGGAAIALSGTGPGTGQSFSELMEVVDEDDENGKHLTSATYAKRPVGNNRWNTAETDLFYEALSMCGTDFSMLATLFPHRTRAQCKGKYKIEERSNWRRVNEALSRRRPFDPTFKDRVASVLGK